jgi:hypothetical protein
MEPELTPPNPPTPTPLDRLKLLALVCIATSPVLDADGLAGGTASFDPVEFSGLSMSMLLSDWACSAAAAAAAALLLWRRWRLDDEERAEDRWDRGAAPGPGMFLGGAAAIGTTPLPPAAAIPLEEPVLPPW